MSLAFAERSAPPLAFAPPPPRSRTVRRIRDDAEALTVARDLAAELAAGAVRRDRERVLPADELEAISDAGHHGA